MSALRVDHFMGLNAPNFGNCAWPGCSKTATARVCMCGHTAGHYCRGHATENERIWQRSLYFGVTEPPAMFRVVA